MEDLEIEKAYKLIHDKLAYMPVEYCCWKKKTSDGKVVSKSLSGDYRPLFSFVKNYTLRNNLAELMFCFDYHQSLFKLHKPGLTFGWQHKLVSCQILAGIYEGILLDLFEYLTSQQNGFAKVLAKQRLDNKSFGLGTLLEVFHQTKIISDSWHTYLSHMVPLRNTIHPKSLNHEDAGFQKNEVIKSDLDQMGKRMEEFLSYAESLYAK